MHLIFKAMPTDQARAFQAGAADANGRVPERGVCTSPGLPCRHCLRDIDEGAGLLTLAYRPFASVQPYAEIGPIFLCADACERYPETSRVPSLFKRREQIMIRGYTTDERILYGTGRIVPTAAIEANADELLADARIAYLHLRSASNNCYQCRIERA